MKKSSILIGSIVLAITIITFGMLVSYSYYQSLNSGNDTSTSIKLNSADIKVIYSNGSILSGTNIVPGWSGVKNFQIKVESSRTISLDINLYVDSSNFYTATTDINGLGASYLQYRLLSCTSLGSNCSSTPVKDYTLVDKNSGLVKVSTISKSEGIYYYQLELKFEDTLKNQKQTGTDEKPLDFKGHIIVSSDEKI